MTAIVSNVPLIEEAKVTESTLLQSSKAVLVDSSAEGEHSNGWIIETFLELPI